MRSRPPSSAANPRKADQDQAAKDKAAADKRRRHGRRRQGVVAFQPAGLIGGDHARSATTTSAATSRRPAPTPWTTSAGPPRPRLTSSAGRCGGSSAPSPRAVTLGQEVAVTDGKEYTVTVAGTTGASRPDPAGGGGDGRGRNRHAAPHEIAHEFPAGHVSFRLPAGCSPPGRDNPPANRSPQ